MTALSSFEVRPYVLDNDRKGVIVIARVKHLFSLAEHLGVALLRSWARGAISTTWCGRA